MKMHGVEEQLHAFLISALDEGDYFQALIALKPGQFSR
jgi:hypothetical protein